MARMIKACLFAVVAVVLGVAPGAVPAQAGEVMGEVVMRGAFKGRDGHRVSGRVMIVRDGALAKVVFAKDFRLDGAPDPRVAFGKGGYVRGTIIAKLRKNRGGQEYIVPERIDLDKYDQVWLWCKKFDSPIAFANLK